MRDVIRVGVFGILALAVAVSAGADALYEAVVRTSDSLTRGTVELEETVSVSAKGGRLRQEVKGARTVLTRRGTRYSKPGYGVVLDQLDRGLRYEVNLDAGTYTEESFAQLRRQHEETIVAAETALKVSAGERAPSLTVVVERTGERQQVHGRECERVILRSTKDVVVAATRGTGPAGRTPSRFSSTFDLCIAPEPAGMREVRALEDRVADLTGASGALLERQLRVFESRRDVLAVYELMQRLMEQEQRKLGGMTIRWEQSLVGPRRDQAQATLYRHVGEITRIEDGALDASTFELPPGLAPDPRRVGP